MHVVWSSELPFEREWETIQTQQQKLVQLGVDILVFAPVFQANSPFSKADYEELVVFWQQFAPASLKIVLGQIIPFSPQLVSLYEQGEIWSLNHSRYLFIDVAKVTDVTVVVDVVLALRQYELIPILVGPERCRLLRENPHVLVTLADLGCQFQLVSQSVNPTESVAIRQAARHFLADELYCSLQQHEHELGLNQARFPLEQLTKWSEQTTHLVFDEAILSCEYQVSMTPVKGWLKQLLADD